MSINNRRDRDPRTGQTGSDEFDGQAGAPAEEDDFVWTADEGTATEVEAFGRYMEALEHGPWTTHFQHLRETGLELPTPEEMDAAALTAKLWEVIDRLAQMRVFLHATDHLSDRELYARLWRETLHEEVPALPLDAFSAWHIDLVSSGSEEDTYFYLKYYADAQARQHWRTSFPDDEIPDHENPPYDRDRRLPPATYGPPRDPESDA